LFREQRQQLQTPDPCGRRRRFRSRMSRVRSLRTHTHRRDRDDHREPAKQDQRPTATHGSTRPPVKRVAGRRAPPSKPRSPTLFRRATPTRPRHRSESTLSKQRSIDLLASDGQQPPIRCESPRDFQILAKRQGPCPQIVSSPDRNGHLCCGSRIGGRNIFARFALPSPRCRKGEGARVVRRSNQPERRARSAIFCASPRTQNGEVRFAAHARQRPLPRAEAFGTRLVPSPGGQPVSSR
jgi:hypothetical protein